ncbi:MAG: hypothetical protein U1C53_02420, partial [Candidatus Veblenbacteria bacterium]|nr:hypothetical protein [Candidatus Veblenbacteria bacterium]
NWYGNYVAAPTGSGTVNNKYAFVSESGAGRVGIGITNPAEQLEVNGAVKIGTTASSNAGTLRWTGTDFEGYTGSVWRSFTGTATSASTVSYVKSLDTNTSSATVSNTASATEIYSYTVLANQLGTNKVMRVVLSGTYLNDTGSSKLLTFNLLFGGTTVLTKQSGSIGANAATGNFEAVFYLMNDGATNSQKASFRASVESGANASVLWDDRATASEDTTSQKVISIEAQHNAASASLTLVRTFAHVEMLNASDALGSHWTKTNDDLFYYDGASNPVVSILDGGVSQFKPAAFDVVKNFDGAATYTNHTTEAKTSLGTALAPLALEAVSNDEFYLGLDHKFATVYADIATAGAGVTLSAQYWNGAWTALSITDNTSNFTADGTITFTAPSDWVTTAVDGDTKYWIRLRSPATNITTAPTAYSVSPTTGNRFYLYAQAGDSTPAFYLNDKGSLGINTVTPGAKLEIKSAGNDYDTKVFRLTNSDNVVLSQVTSDGRFFVGADTGQNTMLTVTKPASGIPSGSSLFIAADLSVSGSPAIQIAAGVGKINTS